MFAESELAQALRCPPARAALWHPHLTRAMTRWGITTRLRASLFLAQIGHESLGLSKLEENLNYSAQRLLEVFPRHFNATTAAQYARRPAAIASRVYAGRLGNGDEASGDGWRFRGRSPVQLTHLGNYAWMQELTDLPLLENPDLALDIANGAELAAAWWQGSGLNTLADANDVLGISRKINLGSAKSKKTPRGLQDRIARTGYAKAALGVA